MDSSHFIRQAFVRSPALLLTALLATAAAMAACSPDSAPTPPATRTPTATPTPAAPPTPEGIKEGGVSSDIVNFTHQDLVVNVGTTITWVNRDSASHTSTSEPSSALRWNSRGLKTGESFSVTFNEPGTYRYRCSIHPRITGTVTVNP